jgi:hypothetical protein
MSELKKCEHCRGEFRETQRDGTIHEHHCPPPRVVPAFSARAEADALRVDNFGFLARAKRAWKQLTSKGD